MDKILKLKKWQSVQKWCAENGITAQESVIRVAMPLIDGNGQYDFNILESNSRRYLTDKTLNRNDLFIPYGMQTFIAFEEVDAAGNPKGKAPMYPYAPKAGVQNPYGFMTDDIEALYNGMLTISFGQTEVNRSFPMLNFKRVPEAQPIGIYNGEAFVDSGIQPEFNLDDVLYQDIPNYYFAGSEAIAIKANFEANGSSFAIAAGTAPTEATQTRKPFLYFYMAGVLVVNGADKPKVSLFE